MEIAENEENYMTNPVNNPPCLPCPPPPPPLPTTEELCTFCTQNVFAPPLNGTSAFLRLPKAKSY